MWSTPRTATLLAGLWLLVLTGPASAQQLRSGEELLAAQVLFQCTDGKPVKPSGYLLALHAGQETSIRDAADDARAGSASRGHAVAASIVVYVEVAGKLNPLAFYEHQKSLVYYRIDCATHAVPAGASEDYPTLTIRANTAEDKATLLDKLRARTERGDLAAVLFSGDRPGNALQPLPAAVASYGDLVSGYGRKEDATFLSDFGGAAELEWRKAGGGTESFKRYAPRRLAETTTTPATTSAVPAAADQGRAVQAGGFVEPQPLRKMQIRFAVANKSLNAIDLAQPGWVETFKYCGPIRREPPAANSAQVVYVLDDCQVNDKLQVPLRILGFETIALKAPAPASGQQKAAPAPVRIDGQLRTRGYSVPYPADWQRLVTDRVEVPPGSLDELTRRQIPVQQLGLAGCQGALSPTASDLMTETLTFPDPPCEVIDLVLPRQMFAAGQIPRVVEGCRPGSKEPAASNSEGRIRCVVTAAERKAQTKRITLAWAPGFLDMPLDIQVAPEIDLAVVGGFLRAEMPAATNAAVGSDAPLYRLKEATYQVGQQACGRPTVPGANGFLASLEEAGCKQTPNRIAFTMEIDREKSDPAVALEAYQSPVVHTVALGGSAPPQPFEAARQRLKMAIAFDADRRDRYVSQFAEPAELVVAGARIFSAPSCQDQGSGRLGQELFAKPGAKADYQWPVYGQVFDNDGRPLTNCAKSIVAKRDDGRPYLTFDFVGTRAVGARRTILLARSQDLMSKPGMARAVETALAQFVRTAHDWSKKGAPLSPVDVISVSQDGSMLRVFTAEEAALQPQETEKAIAKVDRTAPKTPDLSMLRLEPETKGADSLLIVMDGSSITTRQASELRLLGSDLANRKGRGLQFFLSSDSCLLWQPQAPQLKCVELGALRASDRESELAAAFRGMLNPVPEVRKTTEPAAQPERKEQPARKKN